MAELNKLLGINHIRTTSFHPQSNGACERQHSTIMNGISFYVSKGKDDWDRFLPHIQFAINSSVHEGHLFSPHYLLYGYEPVLPAEVELDLPRRCTVAEIAEKVKLARELAVKRLEQRQFRDASYANQHRSNVQFAIGDLVLLRKMAYPRGKSKKLYFNYYGPFTVVAKTSEVNYVVECKSGNKTRRQTVHVEKMKPYYPRMESTPAFVPPPTVPPMTSPQPQPSTSYNLRKRAPVHYSK